MIHTFKNKRKRYLTGIDWAINVLDALSKTAGGVGNSSQIVLELQGPISADLLREKLQDLSKALPVLGGRVGRAWNLCPCWKYRLGEDFSIPLIKKEAGHSELQDAHAKFQAYANTPFSSPKHHLRFHLLNCRRGMSYLGMQFDHRLMDAFGAEVFLDLLTTDSPRQQQLISRINLREPPHLNRWIRQFSGGRNTNRMQLQLSRGGISALPVQARTGRRKTLFEFIHCNAEETQMVRKKLDAGAGFFIALPSILSRVLAPLHLLMKERRCGDLRYVIPVSVVNRKPGQALEKLFFNHISFVFFQADPQLMDSKSEQELSSELIRQMYDQIKCGLPDDIYHASMLTRIAPLKVMQIISKIPLQGRVATSCFACLKESGFKSADFLGAEVNNLFHSPHVPIPPGLGVFLNFFRDRLNLVVSHAEGLLHGAEAQTLAGRIKERLLR